MVSTLDTDWSVVLPFLFHVMIFQYVGTLGTVYGTRRHGEITEIIIEISSQYIYF